jgi:hypothetical protein
MTTQRDDRSTRLEPADAGGDPERGALPTVDRRRAPTNEVAFRGLALLANYALIVTGLFWAIPNFYELGVIWTVLASSVAVGNTRRFLGIIRG